MSRLYNILDALNTKATKAKLKLTSVSTQENKTIATGMSGLQFSPPSGHAFTMLMSAYAQTSGNITMQGIAGNQLRVYNEGSSWTGTCTAYWLCGDYDS